MAATRKAVLAGLVVSCAVGAGWVAGAQSGSGRGLPRAETTSAVSSPDPNNKQAPPSPTEAKQVGEAFVAVAERLGPSVVRVTTRERSAPARRQGGPRLDPFEGTPFERFFRDFGGGPIPESRGERIGTGSGVVIDGKGHILTNEHVVSDAADVRVTFVDGKEAKAKVVGTDPKTDLAVIRVDGATSPPAQFGDADETRVGEWVIAIGNPFGLDHSVTVGVLSAKGRYGFAAGKLEDFLQTDASINPGNSGGPLVNLRGQVIGINTMIAGLGTGVGFAVSESLAKPIAEQLIAHGKVTRPYIGVVMQALSPELRQALGKNAPDKGALVAEVEKGSPADKAGIKVGDVVVRVAGAPTEDSREVQRAVLDQKVGDKIDITVWRNGKQTDVAVRTAEMPHDRAGGAQAPGTPQSKLGLGLQTLTPDLAARLGLDRDSKGAVITSVTPGSAAAEAGVREGDVITAVDGAPVASADEAASRLSASRTGGHLVRVRRGEGALFIAIPSPDK